jgi:glycosyltransferase involved in cell wall biosynthesis
MNADEQPILALVVPCYNEASVLPLTIARLLSQLRSLVASRRVSSASFVCFVDDGSSDATWSIIQSQCEAEPAVRGLKLSRNFGHQNALLAGLLRVKDSCDCAISLDADLQHDEASIPAFLNEFEMGSDIVYGIRRSRSTDAPLKRWTAALFYRLMALCGADTLPNHADYRLLSKRALRLLADFPETQVFLRGLIRLLGLRTATVEFDVAQRAAGDSKYTLTRMISLALRGITSFSVAPLRFVAAVGLLVTVFAFVMSLYALTRVLIFADAVPGWASTVIAVYFLGGVQLFCLGVVGEYVGRIYIETKRRPRFIVEYDHVG